MVVVGRIVAGLETAATLSLSKLNEASIALESSRMMGSGVRVPLRFNTPLKIHGSTRVGFFPGAVVALRGRNGGGGWFSVSEVLSVSEIFNAFPAHSHRGHSFHGLMVLHLHRRKTRKARLPCSSRAGRSLWIPICNIGLGKTWRKLYGRSLSM